ncbi:PQQ-binding-like beta-propeller repeat protein [Promicromonospora sp. NPDC050249]|uniref:outer membrane protein assembly factor BamB family protein n=1 Tax=Promicromonospora sp. NPDC050249 TaxID=3154743 RepID=UPI0033C0AB59
MAGVAVGALLLAGCTSGGETRWGAGDEDPSQTSSTDAGRAPTQSPLPQDVSGYAGDVRRLWSTPEVKTENSVNTIWITGTTVATVTAGGVSAYAPDTGEELWHLQSPEGAGEPCWSSTTLNGDDIGAVLYTSRDEGTCSIVAAVHAGIGEVLWSQPLSDPHGRAIVSGVSAGLEAITVSLGGRGGYFRFSVDSGERLPALKVPAAETCRPYGWQHSARFSVVVTNCEEVGAYVFDTESGDLLFSIPGPVLLDGLAVVPGERLALWQDETLVVFDDDGEVTQEITVPDGRSAGTQAVVTDSAVVGLSGSEQSTPRYPHYAGWDLETGQQLWRAMLPGSDWYPSLWHRPGDAQILVEYPAWADNGAGVREYDQRLGWLDPRDGSLVDAGALPETADVMTFDLVPDGQVVYALTRPAEKMGHVHLVAYELPG